MKSLNKVQLIGNVGKEPETRNTPNGDQVATFTLATTDTYKKDGEKKESTEWHKVVVWRKLAEIVSKYVNKGSKIYLEGKLKTRRYEKDGENRYITEITARDVILLSSNRQATDKQLSSNQQADEQEDNLPF